MSRQLPTVILTLGLVAGLVVRAYAAFTKPVFFHDESHSYQAATGHVAEAASITYGKQPPYGRWAPARQWKSLLRPGRPLCFITVSRDALAHDVHPPLYYWLLHLACLTFGTHYWTGPLLDSVLDVLTYFALYRFARYALADRTAAAVAAFVWVLSAGALQTAVVEARMYSLLALIAVLFTDQLARLVHEPGRVRPARVIVLAALTTAGALTHHHFAILVAGAVGWTLVGRVTRERRRVLYAIGAVAAGYLVLIAVHPFFFGTGWKHLSDAKVPTRAAFVARGRQTVEALSQFLMERRYGSGLPFWVTAALACVVPAVILLAGWRVWRPSHGTEQQRAGASGAAGASPVPVTRYALAVGTWVIGVTLALYLTGVTPAHAMAHRYLAMGWPFVGLATGVLLTGDLRAGRQGQTPRKLLWPAVAACTIALASGSITAWLEWHRLDADHPNAPEAERLVRDARRVVIDNVGRGHWPRPVWRLREDAQVMIALPNDLLRRPAAWRRELEPGTVYISPAQSAVQSRAKIVQSLGRERPVRSVGHLYGIGDVYVLE